MLLQTVSVLIIVRNINPHEIIHKEDSHRVKQVNKKGGKKRDKKNRGHAIEHNNNKTKT